MKLRVVMVDDEPYSRDMFSMSADLAGLDMELVASLESPIELLEGLQDYRPDLVVTDIRMQEMDGLELIRRVQSVAPDRMAFILLSAYSQVEYAKQAIQLGVKYYVVKPYLPAEINDVLRKAGEELREKRRQTEMESRISQSLLGRRIQRLVYDQAAAGTDGVPLPGILRYGMIGLFASDAVTCIRDITALHHLLSALPEVAIVIRQPMRVEFAVYAEEAGALEAACAHVKTELAACALGHDYYAAIGSPVRKEEEIRASRQDAYLMCEQAPWREDRHWMQEAFRPSPRPITNRMPEIVRAMELGERDKAHTLIEEQLREYRESLSSPHVLQLMADQMVYRSLSMNVIADSEALFAEYEARMQNMDRLYVDEAQALLTGYSDRFISLLQAYQEQVRERDDPVLMIRAYIDARHTEQLTVQKIAEDLFFHPAYIGALFKKSMGISIHRYLHQVRVGHAMELMKRPDMKLTQIALEVGYNDYPSFIAAFRQIQGVSPSEFRREETAADDSPDA